MYRSLKFLLIAGALVLTQAFTSCLHQENPELVAARAELVALKEQEARLQQFAPGSYEHFVSHRQYPVNVEIYKDQELLSQVTKKNSRVVICLAQQRGRLYVDGKVAADWPVSTGIPGRETPAGKYTIVEKKEEYSSNRYGKFYNDKGRCVNTDADMFTQAVPEGGRFEGSPMPYWMRLTWDGVGMHIGRVAAGKRLSHGCIRTPRAMCVDLYKLLSVGTRVNVNKELETDFPASEALAQSPQQGTLEENMRRVQNKIYKLTQEELARRS